MVKTKCKNQWLILFLLIAAAIGLGVLQYIPVYKKKADLKETLQAQEMTFDQIKVECEKLPLLEQKLKILQEVRIRYDQRFPYQKEYARLWQQVTDLMDACQLADQKLQPGSESPVQGLSSIPLEIECKGSFEQIFNFFNHLDQFERLIRIESVQIDNDQDLSGLLHMHAKAVVYYQGENAETDA